jgi:nucleoside-diphosphate-sugar epimerase
MQILITGGNGFIGRHLIVALQERGDTVRVLVLPGEDASWLEERGVVVYRGDVREPETLAAPMRGADAVIHLAAMMDVWRPIIEYRAVNVTGTINVCRSALAAGVRRVVHMSSSSVYGMGRGHAVDETSPLAPFRDPYPVTKAEGDRAVQRAIAEDGLPAVIVRPDQIFGPGDHLHFGRTAERLRSGKGIVVGSGRNVLPLVYVTDAVGGLLLALDHDRAVGQAYNITNDERLTQLQFLEAVAREVGGTPPRLHVPFRVLYATGFLAERAAAMTRSRRRPPVTRLGVAFLGRDGRYSIDKARNQLGYVPRVALNEAVRLTATWYLQALADPPVAGPVSHAVQQIR